MAETNNKRKKSKNDKRRFSDDQIRHLESMFESESKLEPRKKVEVARELGLQPRQVAIWFQNKRARWKSKHIEKEYAALLENYSSLAAEFEELKREKQSLIAQLRKLKGEGSDGESESGKIDFEVKNEDFGGRVLDEEELMKMVDTTSDWGGLVCDDGVMDQWWGFWS